MLKGSRYVRLAGKYFVSCFKKFKDIVVSSQEEQPCLRDVEHLVLLTIRQYEGKKEL